MRAHLSRMQQTSTRQGPEERQPCARRADKELHCTERVCLHCQKLSEQLVNVQNVQVPVPSKPGPGASEDGTDEKDTVRVPVASAFTSVACPPVGEAASVPVPVAVLEPEASSIVLSVPPAAWSFPYFATRARGGLCRLVYVLLRFN